MANKFASQYDRLGLQASENEIAARDKGEIIFYAACKKLGLDPTNLPIVHGLDEEYQASLVSFYKLQVIRKALADGRKPNWNSRKEDKWGPWFWMNTPGFRLNDVGCVCADTCATSGSRLCLFEEQDAEFFATECIVYWADFMDGELPE